MYKSQYVVDSQTFLNIVFADCFVSDNSTYICNAPVGTEKKMNEITNKLAH